MGRITMKFAALLTIFFQLACVGPEPPLEHFESFRADHWPRLMQNFSALDKNLGSLYSKDIISHNGSFKHFEDSFKDYGLSPMLSAKLIKLLIKNDKNITGPAYHGLVHSIRITNLVSSALAAKNKSISDQQKLLLIISAMFHDVDPLRNEGTPARVWATLEWMDSDQNAQEVFGELKKETGISTDQIKALIKFTDFDPPKEAEIRAQAEQMAALSFSDGGIFAKEYGPILQFLDKVAMYVGSAAFARQAVVGLANEIRQKETLKRKAEGTYNGSVTTPTDANILSDTPAKFLAPLIRERKYFEWLPVEMQENLKNVHESFQLNWAGKKYVAYDE